MNNIEIYVRHRTDGAMLNIHLNSETKRALIAALEKGQFEDSNAAICLELTVLPEWLTDSSSLHARIPIETINVTEAE